jgi:ABC-type Zn uptake system ZnuABC Zn-binding protein ZnuA
MMLPGCLSSPEPADIAVASYPAMFLVEQIAPQELRVATLGSGQALHDYEPGSRDLDQLRKTTLLVLWDEGLERWAHHAEESLGGAAPSVFELTTLPPGEHLLEPGNDAGEHEDGEHETGDMDDDGHGHGAMDHDPHTWNDPLVMRASAIRFGSFLQQAYPEHAAGIAGRLDDLEARLDDLHAAFTAGLGDCDHDVIITNHQAHNYLARRYGFELLSIHGLTPGSEPAPHAVEAIIDAIKEHNLPAIFIEEGTDHNALRAIKQETGVEVRVLHTLETPPSTGDYLTAQQQNLEELRFALACT